VALKKLENSFWVFGFTPNKQRTIPNKKLHVKLVGLLHSAKYVIKKHFRGPVKADNFHALSNAARGRTEA